MRTKGNKLWQHGCQIHIPDFDRGEVDVITFTGAFDRRQLRRMLRKVLLGKFRTDQIDYIIDTYAIKLKPVTMGEIIKEYEMEAFDDQY